MIHSNLQQLFFTELCEEFEGHRPYDPGKEDNDEIPHAVRYAVSATACVWKWTYFVSIKNVSISPIAQNRIIYAFLSPEA